MERLIDISPWQAFCIVRCSTLTLRDKNLITSRWRYDTKIYKTETITFSALLFEASNCFYLIANHERNSSIRNNYVVPANYQFLRRNSVVTIKYIKKGGAAGEPGRRHPPHRIQTSSSFRTLFLFLFDEKKNKNIL